MITAKNRTVNINTTNAVTGVTAKMRSGANRTSAMTVKIKAPGASAYTTYTYAKAKSIQIANLEHIMYSMLQRIQTNPYRAATKKITITVTGDDDTQIKSPKTVTVEYSASRGSIQ